MDNKIQLLENDTCMKITDFVEPFINMVLQIPPTVKKLIFLRNIITTFDGNVLPDGITELIYEENNTSSLVNLKEGIKSIVITKNFIKEITIPDSVITCELNENRNLNEIHLGSHIISLNITITAINSIDNFPSSIEVLVADFCTIPLINKFPPNLKTFSAINSDIEEITCDFPQSLQEVDLSSNNIKLLPDIRHISRFKMINDSDDEMPSDDDSDDPTCMEILQSDDNNFTTVFERHADDKEPPNVPELGQTTVSSIGFTSVVHQTIPTRIRVSSGKKTFTF